MTTYAYRCPEGHVIEEQHSILDYPREVPCSAHGTTAHMILTRNIAGLFFVDNVSSTDYTAMAGRNFSSAKERDRWLDSQQRWIPEANHPKMKEAFQYLDHQREEKQKVLDSGKQWEEHVQEQAWQKDHDIQENMRNNNVSITQYTPDQAASLIRKSEERGKGDARWLQEKMALCPDTPASAFIPQDLNIPDMDLEMPE